ncbi:MAG TPA: HEPN domain-containing protein [Candidatus Acidoferrum sp.]|nr:HEPN domain-containing protein [Candidatus Acidoferrum sp.]
MNRTDLQQLAELRLKEANVLFAHRCFEGAYYLAGYSVECAIKACFARKTQQHDFPDKKAVDQIWKHDLEQLISAAGLEEEWDRELKSNRIFNRKWAVVKQWSEQKRYSTKISSSDARDLLSAINDSAGGVLIWLKKLW